MAKNAERFSELLESICTTKNDKKIDSAGVRIIDGWEQLVKSTASKALGKKLIVCNRAVYVWDEEVKEAIRRTDAQAGEADTGIATLRAQKGNVVRSLKGKRELLVEHYRKLGTPTTNETLDAEFEKEINAWAEENVDVLEKE